MNDKRFGKIVLDDDETYEHYWRCVRVMGMEYIFRILCLIAKIMLFKLTFQSPTGEIFRNRVYEFSVELDKLENGESDE